MQYLQAKTIYSVSLWKTARLQQDLSLYLGQFIVPNTTYQCVQLQTTFVSLIGALSMKVLYHWHFNWTKLQYHGRLPHFSMTFYCFNNISIYTFGSCANQKLTIWWMPSSFWAHSIQRQWLQQHNYPFVVLNIYIYVLSCSLHREFLVQTSKYICCQGNMCPLESRKFQICMDHMQKIMMRSHY